MATTTNYSWVTPDDTALVKDGASAIRTLGSSIDTTTKALNPSTTLGDIEYRSSSANTNTRLGIGTTGQVLTVSGGVPSWATGSSGGMTLLSTLNLAGVSSATTSAFSSAYKQIFIYLTGLYAATANETLLRLNGDSGATKYTANFILGSGGSVSTGATGGDSKYYVADLTTDSTAKYQNSAFITIMKPSNTSKFFISSSAVTYVAGVKNFQTVGTYDGSAEITSVTIASGVNFTAGTAEIYGVN
jgi:hypothetical protein